MSESELSELVENEWLTHWVESERARGSMWLWVNAGTAWTSKRLPVTGWTNDGAAPCTKYAAETHLSLKRDARFNRIGGVSSSKEKPNRHKRQQPRPSHRPHFISNTIHCNHLPLRTITVTNPHFPHSDREQACCLESLPGGYDLEFSEQQSQNDLFYMYDTDSEIFVWHGLTASITLLATEMHFVSKEPAQEGRGVNELVETYQIHSTTFQAFDFL